MLKKEMSEAVKHALVFIGIVVALPLLILVITRLFGSTLTFGELFFGVFQVGLLVLSVFMGISLFSRDMRDNGLEYMLTLPYSRLQVLGCKFLPRFLVLVAAFVLYLVLLGITGITPETSSNVPMLPAGFFSFLAVSLFIIGILFSINKGSIVISALAALFGFILYLVIIHLGLPTALLLKGQDMKYIETLFSPARSVPVYLYFSAVLLLLGAAAAFVHAFRRFNLATSRGFISRFLKVFVPVLVIAVGISVAWAVSQIKKPYSHYYLTSDHRLVESQIESLKIYDKNGVTDLNTGEFYWNYYFTEQGPYLYMVSYSIKNLKILRTDLRDTHYKLETVYESKSDDKRRVVWGLYFYKDRCAFIERSRENILKTNHLVMLQPETGTSRMVKIHDPARIEVHIFLFGVVESEGQYSWLACTGSYKHWEVLRIREDGRIDSLGFSNIKPAFANGILITGESSFINFSKITSQGVETFKQIPVVKGFFIFEFIHTANNLEHLPVKELYGGIKKNRKGISSCEKFYRLDLDSLQLEKITPPGGALGNIYYAYPETWYYLAYDSSSYMTQAVLKNLYKVREGKFELIKEFPSVVLTKDFEATEYVNVFDAGLVLRRDGITTIYSLPSGEEIHFKELR